MTYRGTKFRSTLEANWAATFDHLGWYWWYEPEAVKIDKEPYLCDFFLPYQRVWCEVKGPHDERIRKPGALQKALRPDPWDVWRPIVVILRPPGPGDTCVWEAVDDSQQIVVASCPECGHHCFMDWNGVWACRHGCRNGNVNKFWMLDPVCGVYWPGELEFVRARRESL